MHLHLPGMKKKHLYLFESCMELVRTPVYCTVHDILTHTLIHLRAVEKNLKYWQSVKGSPPQVAIFSELRTSLSIFLSKVYAENHIFTVRANLRQDRSRFLVFYIRTIITHFTELEESITHLSRYLTPPIQQPLSFLKLDENDDHLLSRWSPHNFKGAVDLLSTNLNKLDHYVSLLVVKYRKPSKMSRHWMYYTFGAIGVSGFSLWLLRDDRLSGVVHNSLLVAKELVTGLFIDPIKRMTLANDRYDELMKLKQVQSTRDYSLKKELKYPTRNLSGEDSARPMLNQIQKLKLAAETAREVFDLNHEILIASERTITTLAAIPAIVFSLGGLMISYALLEQVLDQGRNAGPQARLLVKEVEKRFKEYMTQRSQNGRHYAHGLLLCTLDRLDRATESSAKKTGEWDSLREELTALGKLNYPDSDKLVAISHFKEAYACLSPPSRSGASGWWAW